ncbi:MAG: AzlD domain-containing protein [Oscillospiraceae bacterium]|jgi:branched-subunit amino acid transport protein AzlD|nr:AzlD domain-containing protein [Oscillospiraceae bacterium]
MPLTPTETLVMIFAIALGTAATRFAPFLLFPEKKTPAEAVTYLGKCLPPAMLGLLTVYCLREAPLSAWPHGLPQITALAVIVILHRWKNNVLLSIGGGTLVYMLLVQTVFK